LLVLVSIAALALTAPAAAQELSMVPVEVDGEAIRLEMRLYKSAQPGRAPTFVFNHGSTGEGSDPVLYKRRANWPGVAQFFVARGWAVVMPWRRGRGGSEGTYAEGLDPAGSRGYVCDGVVTIAGADRALRDIAAAMKAIRAMPFVDPDRILIGGVSRGGILSAAYAGVHPTEVIGVVNFVGGWVGTACSNAADTNQRLSARGARYPGPMLWLYGENDPYYSLEHSRANFAAFTALGGKAGFHAYPSPNRNGHAIAEYPALWSQHLDNYLKLIGAGRSR
jgi:dienelactone hydrolase